MLLAVTGLAEAGLLTTDEIRFSHAFLDPYHEIVALAKNEADHAHPYLLFFI